MEQQNTDGSDNYGKRRGSQKDDIHSGPMDNSSRAFMNDSAVDLTAAQDVYNVNKKRSIGETGAKKVN